MGRLPHIIEKTGKGERVYDLYSRLLKDRIVFVTGVIGKEMCDDVVAQLLLLEASEPEAAIYMYINSGGGAIDGMFAIYDTMQYVTCPIITIGYGQVMSAASFLVAGGEPGQRFALPNTNFMIHELASGIEGKFKDMHNYQKHLDRVHNKLIDGYVKFTGASRTKLEKDMSLDCYLTSEEALSYGKKGLIDKIQEKSNRKNKVDGI